MYQSSVRSATAGTGKTFLALVAVLSLVLAALAITSPALATHQEDNPPIPITNDQGLGAWEDQIDCEGSHVKIDSEGTLVAGTHTYSYGDFWVTLTVVLDEDGEVESITIVDSSHDIDAVYTQGGNDVDGPEAGAGPFTQSNGAAISFIVFCLGELQDADEFLEVVKNVDPADDPTEFSFGFTGEADAAVRGPHGTTTGMIEVVEGDYVVAESPVEGYDTSIRCVLRGTETVVGEGMGTSLDIQVTDGQDVLCVITNVRQADEAGMADVQIHKWVCAGDETTTTIEIFGPVGIASAADQAPEEGCERASEPWEFVILDSEGTPVQAYDDEGTPLASIMTGETGTVRVSIETDDDGENFTLVELHPDLDPDPSLGFTLATGELITFRVANYFGEGELPTGEVKILKSFCGEFEDGLVRFAVNGVFQDELENIDLEPCEASDDFSFYFDGDTEATFTTTNGLYVEALGEGEHTLTEVETGATVTFTVVAGEETEIEVFNWAPAGEGTAPEEETPTGEGTMPSSGGPSGEGTLPNTAASPELTGSLPAALLALVMLTGLGAAGYAMQAEARRRR